jgi:hypothetical protein
MNNIINDAGFVKDKFSFMLKRPPGVDGLPAAGGPVKEVDERKPRLPGEL